MANFPVLPFRFLPGPVTIEPSPEDRLQRSLLIVGDPPLQHEEYAIIVVVPELEDIDKEEALAEVCAILNRDHNAPVTGRVYSIGIGLVRFESAAIRDHLIETGPHTMDRDEIHMFSVVRHDEGLNMRSPVFEREAWVLMLNFPLDYQTNYYVNKAVSLFGKQELWHNPRLDMTRVLVKVLIKSLSLVSFSLVVTRAANLFGVLGRSWSVPVYVLHGRIVNPQLIGYGGSSMMDGVVPEENVSDDPDTWSPSLSDMEDAADDVVHGRQNGGLRFIRAGGDNMMLQVESLPGTWADTFKYLYLGEDGELCWAPIDLEQEVSNVSWAVDQPSASNPGPAAGPRRPGRPRKSQEAPKVKSSVRYCTRNNNEGYCHQVLADTRRPRKTEKVVAPDILQIEEMQRIGIEDCQIDPAELTAERLMQEKK
ncbi:hypothetical protein ACQ4PT_050357 [Festuca glaucescens]